MTEKNRQAAITAVYDALHKDKLGAHWLWCVIEKIAAGQSEEDAMRDFGYYSRALAATTAPAPTESPAEAMCPTCNGEGGWEHAHSTTNYSWVKCADCATPPTAVEAAQLEAVGDMVRVDRAALHMVISALRRDAEQGRSVRGEMADMLLAAAPTTEATSSSDAERLDAARYRWLRDMSEPPHNFYISVPVEFHGERYKPHEVDAYIDAAIATKGGKL